MPSGAVPPAVIADARATKMPLLWPDSVEVLRDTQVSDNAGGYTIVEAVVATVDGKLRPAGGGDERPIADRLGWEVAYAIDLPYDADVRADDRLRVNGARTFEIAPPSKGGAWGLKQTAVAREMG